MYILKSCDPSSDRVFKNMLRDIFNFKHSNVIVARILKCYVYKWDFRKMLV